MSPSILILTSRFPFPLEKGDKLRIYNQIKSLSKNHEVTLVAINHKKLNQDQIDALSHYCRKMHVFVIPWYSSLFALIRSLFSGLPFQVGIFYSATIKRKIHKLIHAEKPGAIYCHLIRMSEYVRDIQGIRKTIDYMDVFSAGMKKRLDITSNPVKRILFEMEYQRLLSYEKNIFDHFQERIIISKQDRDNIPHGSNSLIKIVPNGVDFSVFKPVESEKKYDLLFTGHMGYPPNIESAYYTATQIIPLLKKKFPAIKYLIAGVGAPARIRNLASENIIIIEKWENISEAFVQSRVMIAPMLISIGLQNKILQAMAMKIPVVATELANNAINAPEGKAILIAGTPADFAERIGQLLQNENLSRQLAEDAYEFVLENYSWEKHNNELARFITAKEQ